MAKVLAVLSSGYKDQNYTTGWWGEELFAPMQALEAAGHTVELASPLGGRPDIDPLSIQPEWDPQGTYRALHAAGRADQTQRLADVNPAEYAAVLVVGGHGAMFDLAKNADLHRIINQVYDNGGIVAAECHGPAALIWTLRPNGISIIQGKRVTGYPEAWEPEALKDVLPFSLERELRLIADYTPGPDQSPFAVWADRQIITSRDPASSRLMGEQLVQALAHQPVGAPAGAVR